MRNRIFLSYRREDTVSIVGRLHDRLQVSFGRERLFMDVDSIPLGMDYRGLLEDRVAECEVFLAIIGPNWLHARDSDGQRRLDNPHDFVRIEIAAALKRNIRTIPVLIDHTPMPRSQDLPDELKELASRNGVDLTFDSFRLDVERLIQRINDILSEAPDKTLPARLLERIIHGLRFLFIVAKHISKPRSELGARLDMEANINGRIRELARRAGRERDLAQLDEHVERLPEGTTIVLKDVPKLRTMVQEIAQLQRRLNATQRPAFQEPMAEQLVTKIENFWHRVAGLSEPLASEYRVAALEWQSRAAEQLEDIRNRLAHAPKAQVFRAGDPVDRSNEAFVPRMNAVDLLERQITLAQGCPGLLIYGRRRMGKSTLLLNLSGFLPPSVRVAIVSMQNPRAFSSQESLAGLLLQAAWAALGQETPVTLPKTLSEMFAALDIMNERLGVDGQRLFLACDEFEMIDRKIAETVFSIDLLHTFRESIQTHRRIVWAFAGSHSLGELVHADWASYFVSLRTVEITHFTPEETRLLLTEPLRYSPLWKERPGASPRFTSFWGQDGIKGIHVETGGWPHLVQLAAETCVDLANDRGADTVDAPLLEEAFDEAVRRGDSVLRQLIEGESCLPGEKHYLLGFREQEVQPVPGDSLVRRALRRRRLVVDNGGKWRLRVPLMRRWMIANG
jgi:TIR domain